MHLMLDKQNKVLRTGGMHLRDKDEKLSEAFFCSGWTKMPRPYEL